jgi:hypothetical protein
MGMLLWFLAGFCTWMTIRLWQGELFVGDVILAVLVGIPGPTLPLILASWYAGVFLERFAQIRIWKRKNSKLTEPLEAQA